MQTFISYHYIEFHWKLHSQNTTFSFYVSVSPMRTYTNLGQQEDTYSHVFTVLYIKTINKQNQILLREFFAIDIYYISILMISSVRLINKKRLFWGCQHFWIDSSINYNSSNQFQYFIRNKLHLTSFALVELKFYFFFRHTFERDMRHENLISSVLF